VRRPLTPNERAVIERLLTVDFPEVAGLGGRGDHRGGRRFVWLMLMQADGWLSELEHVPGYGPRPNELDATKIAPESAI
jgi:hypothetical protein